MGPDAPVYLWWMRAAGSEGLSVIGQRPGTTSLMLSVAGALHLSPVSLTAGLEVALGVSVGLAACAFARGCEGASRAGWTLAGGLVGLFAVHLVAGYLSNLVFAVGFLAACHSVGVSGRRATVAAAVLLGAAGLAHPQFFIPGAVILAIVAGWALVVRRDRDEFSRLGLSVAGGGAIVGAGLLSMLIGPARLAVDTSRDGFLRRVGLGDVVRSAYADRFVHRWTRYVQWVSLPLAAAGYLGARGTGGRILRAWLAVIVVGIPVGLLTGRFPADRLITFGYAVPILAGFGVVWVFGTVSRWRGGVRLAVASCAVLLLLMAAGSFIAWHRQEPFIDERQTAQLEVLNRDVAATPPGTPIVVEVESQDQTATFDVTQTANLVRAGVPPDRIGDVYVVLTNQLVDGDAERRALEQVTAADADAAVRAASGDALLVRLSEFMSDDARFPTGSGVSVTTVPPTPLEGGVAVEPLEPSSPGGIALASVAVLALLWFAGYGWARAATDATAAAALAPAYGIAAITVLAIVTERLGLPLDGSVGPTLVSLVAGAGGYAAWRILGEPVPAP